MIEYSKNGFLKLKGFYNHIDIEKINQQLPKTIKNKKNQIIYEIDDTNIRSVMSYHNNNEVLNHYSRESKILKIVEELLESKVYISQSKINLKKGVLGKKWDYHRGFTFWHLLDGMPNPKMISVFICLSKQSKENGAVYVLKRSHVNVNIQTIKNESTIINNRRENDTSANLSIQIKKEYLKKYSHQFEKVYLTGDIGDVFLMHPCLLHASDNNKTSDSRDLMITVYNSVDNLPTLLTRPSYLCEKFSAHLNPWKRV